MSKLFAKLAWERKSLKRRLRSKQKTHEKTVALALFVHLVRPHRCQSGDHFCMVHCFPALLLINSLSAPVRHRQELESVHSRSVQCGTVQSTNYRAWLGRVAHRTKRQCALVNRNSRLLGDVTIACCNGSIDATTVSASSFSYDTCPTAAQVSVRKLTLVLIPTPGRQILKDSRTKRDGEMK